MRPLKVWEIKTVKHLKKRQRLKTVNCVLITLFNTHLWNPHEISTVNSKLLSFDLLWGSKTKAKFFTLCLMESHMENLEPHSWETHRVPLRGNTLLLSETLTKLLTYLNKPFECNIAYTYLLSGENLQLNGSWIKQNNRTVRQHWTLQKLCLAISDFDIAVLSITYGNSAWLTRMSMPPYTAKISMLT